MPTPADSRTKRLEEKLAKLGGGAQVLEKGRRAEPTVAGSGSVTSDLRARYEAAVAEQNARLKQEEERRTLRKLENARREQEALAARIRMLEEEESFAKTTPDPVVNPGIVFESDLKTLAAPTKFATKVVSSDRKAGLYRVELVSQGTGESAIVEVPMLKSQKLEKKRPMLVYLAVASLLPVIQG